MRQSEVLRQDPKGLAERPVRHQVLPFPMIARRQNSARSGLCGRAGNCDGSKAAFEKIRSDNCQFATVAEPLSRHGWRLIGEANRALAGEQWSGYVAPTHLVTKYNIGSNVGPNNGYDPENGYREVYQKIWGRPIF